MNQINVIYPYKHQGLWVFDDANVGLNKEPFVGGADIIIDVLTSKITDPHRGFTLLFSANQFAGYQHRIEWLRQENGGNVYLSPEIGIEGWLCPALFRYFDTAPRTIYIRIEPRALDI